METSLPIKEEPVEEEDDDESLNPADFLAQSSKVKAGEVKEEVSTKDKNESGEDSSSGSSSCSDSESSSSDESVENTTIYFCAVSDVEEGDDLVDDELIKTEAVASKKRVKKRVNKSESTKGVASSLPLIAALATVECPYCDEMCRTVKQVDRHVMQEHRHDPSLMGKFQCQICSSICWTENELLSHTKEDHPDYSKCKCHKCDLSFNTREELSQHKVKFHGIIEEEPIATFECPECGESFLTKALLKNHAREVHVTGESKKMLNIRGESLQCPLCDYCPKQVHMLKKHIEAVHNKPNDYCCHLCGYKCKFAADLRSHIKSNCTRKVKYECEHCGKHFERPYKLQNHINIVHKKIKNFSCFFCNMTFSYRYNLQEHERVRHNIQKADYKCHFCDFTTPRFLDRLNHEKEQHPEHFPIKARAKSSDPSGVHRPTPPHRPAKVKKEKCDPSRPETWRKCNMCDFITPSGDILKNHLLFTHQDKKFVCEVCGAKFPYNYRLKAHQFSKHLKLPLYQCTLCSFGCNQKKYAGKHFKKLHPEVQDHTSLLLEVDWTPDLKEALLREKLHV